MVRKYLLKVEQKFLKTPNKQLLVNNRLWIQIRMIILRDLKEKKLKEQAFLLLKQPQQLTHPVQIAMTRLVKPEQKLNQQKLHQQNMKQAVPTQVLKLLNHKKDQKHT
uniref:Uncharacterized protein n=1 Tax=Cacopsylla melanoneura TaxID=428564 RepID=A0A8D9BG19_9HEMI